MNTPFYIAQRLALNEKKSFSRYIIQIAILAVALSTAVMIIGSAITRGYQEVIQNKFYDCWGHIHITTFLADPGAMNSMQSFEYDSVMVKKMNGIPQIASIQSYTIQSAILKTKKDIEGIMLKGIRTNNDVFSIQNYIVKGHKLSFSDSSYSKDILVSEITSDKLMIAEGDELILYFLTENEIQPRARKVKVAGIYKTGLEDYDNLFAICDARLINHINQKSENSIQGYEIYLKDKKDKEIIEKEIYDKFIQPPLQTYSIDQRFQNIFSWLGMMKMNEQIIIGIMLIIAIINMITALLILVLERTRMIGILKSLGMTNFKIQQIFIYSSVYILSIGLLIGTVTGIALSLLQLKFGLIHLDEKTYYIKSVPIFLDATTIILINLIALFICSMLLLIPSFIVKTISPSKAIKFS